MNNRKYNPAKKNPGRDAAWIDYYNIEETGAEASAPVMVY